VVETGELFHAEYVLKLDSEYALKHKGKWEANTSTVRLYAVYVRMNVYIDILHSYRLL
jgi:hypothetical protein